MTPSLKPHAASLLQGAIVLVYIVLGVAYFGPRSAVENLDFWTHIRFGQELDWSQPETLVNGLYPLGYPLMLRMAIGAGIDVLRFGQLLAWSGGLLMLLSVFGIAHRITGSPVFAAASASLLIGNSHFREAATVEGNDMLSAGLQMAALLLLWRMTRPEGTALSRKSACVAGFTLGLAYLARYTALILLPPFLLFVLWRAHRPARRALAGAGLLLGGFILATSVQTVPSLVVAHHPFHTTQAKNVWFAIHGGQDWVERWEEVPDSITLVDVVLANPARFADHWWAEVTRAFRPPGLWSTALHLATLAGGVVLMLDRRLHPAGRVLLLLAWTLPLAVTGMAWLAPRYMLVPLAVQALTLALLADRIAELLPVRRVLAVGLACGALVLAASPLRTVSEVGGWLDTPARSAPQDVNALLRLAGMENPLDVATNDPYLHATDVPARTRYPQLYPFAPRPDGPDDVLWHVRTFSWRYLVLNYEAGFGDYAAFRDGAPAYRDRLVPLALGETASVYCVGLCLSDGIQPDDTAFDNGMRLLGHRLRTGPGRVGVYLSWHADSTIGRSYKVSVRVVGPDDEVLFQSDGVPQRWTHPTDEWRPGETVGDFHVLGFDPVQTAGGKVVLVVYDAATNEPMWTRLPSGKRGSAVVVLDRLAVR